MSMNDKNSAFGSDHGCGMPVQEDKKFFWTYEVDGEIQDLECETKAKAQEAADQWWEEKNCDNEEMRNGDTFDEEIFLISFYYDDEGERVIDEREESSVEYEHYHGDFAEHNTLWGL